MNRTDYLLDLKRCRAQMVEIDSNLTLLLTLEDLSIEENFLIHHRQSSVILDEKCGTILDGYQNQS